MRIITKKYSWNNKMLELFGADLRSLALLRVGVAGVTILDLLQRIIHIIPFYSDTGVLTAQEAREISGDFIFSLHNLNGHWGFQLYLLLVALIPAVMLLIGYKTRLATILSWLMLISLQARNPFISQGNDDVQRLILFWGMFLPWGERFSLDSTTKSEKNNYKNQVFSLGILAYLLQVAYIYTFNGLVKTDPMWTTDGTAIAYALSLDQFTTPLGYVLLSFPFLTTTMTHMVYYLETYAPLLLFSPILTQYIRPLGAFLLMGMHFGIGMTMAIGLFPYLDIISLMAFIPSWMWNVLFKKLAKIKQFNISIYYDGDCGFCYKAVRIIKSFLVLPTVKTQSALADPSLLQEMSKENSWIITDKSNMHYHHWQGVVRVLKASPILFPFAWIFNLPGIKTFGQRIYQWIATHRKTVCVIPQPPTPKTQWLTLLLTVPITFTILFFAVYVFIWNLNTLGNPPIRINSEYDWVANTFRLNQKWGFFAPSVLREDGWYVIVGTFADGSQRELLQNTEIISFEKPQLVSATYPDYRWRRYLMNLYLQDYTSQRPHFARYLCHHYNAHSQVQLDYIEMYFMLEINLPENKTSEPEKTLLYEGSCVQ